MGKCRAEYQAKAKGRLLLAAALFGIIWTAITAGAGAGSAYAGTVNKDNGEQRICGYPMDAIKAYEDETKLLISRIEHEKVAVKNQQRKDFSGARKMAQDDLEAKAKKMESIAKYCETAVPATETYLHWAEKHPIGYDGDSGDYHTNGDGR